MQSIDDEMIICIIFNKMMKRIILFMSIFLSIGAYAQDSYYYDGNLIKFYNTDHYFISASLKQSSRYGNYYSVSISVMNKDINRFDFIPENMSAIYTRKNKDINAHIISYKGFYDKVKDRQQLENFFNGLAVGFQEFAQSEQIGSAKVTSNGKTSNVTVYGNNQNLTKTMVHNYNQTESEHLRELKSIKGGYLKRNTLFPNMEIKGFVNIKYMDVDKLSVDIPIDGNTFNFSWSFEKTKREDDVYFKKTYN